ncbi:uncharacterized protein J7T54_004218 [Emericellopsis cladophorae]|uniref:Uncharacterized protein n=1 Tax=Emericellopsis cladophorae TaxID=2686198 RepID=A0A9P9XY82_9HYPO|nr:uncharacterized protein J7T54_004218 [Emericellopsis cladophorae]KAI6780086.1 hypothetical protein J7T54_004218 [Emericellopsis cladophorae]
MTGCQSASPRLEAQNVGCSLQVMDSAASRDSGTQGVAADGFGPCGGYWPLQGTDMGELNTGPGTWITLLRSSPPFEPNQTRRRLDVLNIAMTLSCRQRRYAFQALSAPAL